MNKRESRYERLLKAYPKHYRDQRGEEILATLLDSSSAAGGDIPAFGDVVDIISHGTQRRLGLTQDRFGGRVLDLAALPGLTMGAAFAVFLFIWGEWLTVTHHPVVPIEFGPFLTIGPVIYLMWILAAAGSILRPQWRRTLAVTCMSGTVVVWTVGRIAFASPNFWQTVILVSLGIPAMLAPTRESARHSVTGSLVTGAMTFAVVWWFSSIHPVFGYRISFYTYGNYSLAQGIPWLAGALLLTTIALFALRKPDLAGAVVVLACPLLIVAAAYVRDANGVDGRVLTPFVGLGAICLFIPIAWLAAAWSLDLRRPTMEHADPM